jgi:UDP:flavonoid glycosyltransferase YjiC (YdhE family)
MARILVATVPLTGHVQPMRLVVKELVARGHDVRWYGARKFRAAIEATGARFAAMRAAPDWDDADVEAALPVLRGKRGLARVKLQLREMFVAPMIAQLRDLEALVDDEPADAILADSAHLGAALLHERRHIAWASLGISALVMPSPDVAPFGSAMPPERGSRFLNWLIFRVVFGDVNRALRRARAGAGVPPGTGTYFDVWSPQLFLQPTVEAFEYPRRDLPPHLHFIGPLVPREAPTTLPAWWSELEDARRERRPVVLVTQGTLATDPRELIAPALRALARDPVLVIATLGGGDRALVGEVPGNARVEAFVPYEALLPHVSVMVTNGGYGGVQMALRHGVPLVVAGGSEEKPEIAARVRWCGAGLDLRTGRPRPSRVRRAVQRVLADERFRLRARQIASEMERHDAPREATQLLEALITTRAPITRALSTGGSTR